MKNPGQRYWLIGFGAIASFALAGSRSNCTSQAPSLNCRSVNIQLQAGQCTQFANPCSVGGTWSVGDSFVFDEPPPGISVQTSRALNVETRAICADLGTNLNFPPLNYTYSDNGEFGSNVLAVNSVVPLSVSVTPPSTTIQAGGSVQLNADANGGVPPYSYSWFPTAGLSQFNVSNPVATPAQSTTYTVTVTDSQGSQATGSASVTVQSAVQITASASPSQIRVGGVTQLSATVTGSAGPFDFNWSPPARVTNPGAQQTTARPTVSTTYTVTAVDGLGNAFSATTAVSVALQVTMSSVPPQAEIPFGGGSVQLVAAAQGGGQNGSASYAFSWSPATGLDNPSVSEPVASPTVSTTYNVTVTDGINPAVTNWIAVGVSQENGLFACFTISRVPNTNQVNVDASCSTDNGINTYEWNENWNGDQSAPFDVVQTTPFLTFPAVAGQVIRLVLVDSTTGATASVAETVPN